VFLLPDPHVVSGGDVQSSLVTRQAEHHAPKKPKLTCGTTAKGKGPENDRKARK
jgi:hypothetical protein